MQKVKTQTKSENEKRKTKQQLNENPREIRSSF